jgi:hypothetical protein
MPAITSVRSKVVDLLVRIRRNNSTARRVTPLARSLFRLGLITPQNAAGLYHYVGVRSAANSAVFKFNNSCAKFTYPTLSRPPRNSLDLA